VVDDIDLIDGRPLAWGSYAPWLKPVDSYLRRHIVAEIRNRGQGCRRQLTRRDGADLADKDETEPASA
jgi:hypothetical protein